jgi:hypothetical protein
MGPDDEKWIDARADRPPTEDEARAAEDAASRVDLASVAEHASEMAKLGANVRGSGQIEPWIFLGSEV